MLKLLKELFSHTIEGRLNVHHIGHHLILQLVAIGVYVCFTARSVQVIFYFGESLSLAEGVSFVGDGLSLVGDGLSLVGDGLSLLGDGLSLLGEGLSLEGGLGISLDGGDDEVLGGQLLSSSRVGL